MGSSVLRKYKDEIVNDFSSTSWMKIKIKGNFLTNLCYNILSGSIKFNSFFKVQFLK